MSKETDLLKEYAKKAEDTYYMFDRDANKATTPAEKKEAIRCRDYWDARFDTIVDLLHKLGDVDE